MTITREHINKIDENLFQIQIPLPKSPLRFLNSYLIRSESRSLIIDTGLNTTESYLAMLKSLKEVDVELRKSDFFITHLHSDHIGLVSKLAENSRVYLSNIEKNIVANTENSYSYWLEIKEYLSKNGFPEKELNGAFETLNRLFIETYPLSDEFKKIDFLPLKDGDVISYGNYNLRGVLTPGHSPGHMCLYEADKKMLFSGDHILFDITPNITWWPSVANPLKDYIDSLTKIYNLDIKLVLPGHGRTGTDLRKRIDEIKDHHKKRVGEIVSALQNGKNTAYDIAESITWNLKNGGWKSFPESQRFFAVGETISHLIYMEHENIIESMPKNGTIYYFLPHR